MQKLCTGLDKKCPETLIKYNVINLKAEDIYS